MIIDDELFGIAQLNNRLLNLNKSIFNLIKEDVIRIEEGDVLDYDTPKILYEEFGNIFETLEYVDSENLKNYFYKLIDVNKVLSTSVLVSGLDIDNLAKNITTLLGLHLDLQGNLLKQSIFRSDGKLIDSEQEKTLLTLKIIFNKEKNVEGILSDEINELINDVDRATYSSDLNEYKNNKDIRIKILHNKDN